MNNGKHLEKLVRLIQESMKNIPETKITSNAKLLNNANRKREFDILIETVINAIDIKIVIECKDYNTPVSAEKIEAFQGKCDRIPEISKKVFVSSNGYQVDAINAAKENDIVIYTLAEIDKNTIADWFPIKQLKISFKLENALKLFFCVKEEDLKNVPQHENMIVYFDDENESPIELYGFIWNSTVCKEQHELYGSMLLNFMKHENTLEPVRFPFKLELGGVYVKGIGDKKFYLGKVEGTALGLYKETAANYIEARVFERNKSTSEASVVSLDVGKEGRADIIYIKDDVSIFHTNKSGEVNKMQTLVTYDKKTDELKIISIRKK
jgi:hypothetical protein